MAVAAHYGHLHIVEYLANRPELDDTLTDPERSMVCTACQAGDTERVLALLDGIYADQLKRSQLMSAFLMQDVDSAKSRILQYKHREKAIRQGQDKRYVNSPSGLHNVCLTKIVFVSTDRNTVPGKTKLPSSP